MSQDQAIEAARARIQRLVEEIAALSKKDMRSEEYFQQFLTRAVQACDARGGAVWLVGQRGQDGSGSFELVAQVDLESSLFQSDEQQRALLLKGLAETVQRKQPTVIAAAHHGPQPGSIEAQVREMQGDNLPSQKNKTTFPFLHVPLFLKEQVLGVLQVWLQPYVTVQNYAEFSTFLTSLATHVEQHLQSRRLGNLVVENQRLQHVLRFTHDLAGSLDATEVARLAANYGRDLLSCERCSVLVKEGKTWRVLAISGQEVVEKKSQMVKAMAAFVEAHVLPEFVILSKQRLLEAHAANGAEAPAAEPATETADAPADSTPKLPLVKRNTEAIDQQYFELSHVVSAAVAPMLNEDKEIIGAFFAESTTDGYFEAPPGAKEASSHARLSEWLATHTGRAITAAQSYESLPFLPVTSRIRDARIALRGNKRRRFLMRMTVFLVILGAVCFYPKMEVVDGDCSLLAQQRAMIVPEMAGRVEKVLVREGSVVKKGDPLAQLDTSKLEAELTAAQNEKRALYAEAERYRGGPQADEAAAQIAITKARVAEANERRLQIELESATLRSPIDGVVLTKNIEQRVGEALQPGSLFAEVAARGNWELHIEVDEREVGRVEEVVAKKEAQGGVPVQYILKSQTAYTLRTILKSDEQISAQAYAPPNAGKNVFYVTIRELAIPSEIEPAMRHGLSGRAKLELGRKPFAYLIGRRIWNWFRLKMIG